MFKLLFKNKIVKKIQCTIAALCLLLCFMASVFASNIGADTVSSGTASSSTALAGGTAFIAAYNVVDDAGNEIVNLYPGMKCTVAFIVVDSRFEDSETSPWMGYNVRDDLTANIHAKINSSNFTSVTGSDARVQKRENVNGVLSYAVAFHDTVYQGQEGSFAFDLSFTQKDSTSGYEMSMGVSSTTLSQSIAQCTAESEGVKTAKPSVMVKNSSYGDSSVDAGSTFTLIVTSYNTSRTKNITDVKTTISLPQQLTLASGSNMVLTTSVAAGQSFANTFELQAQSDAETGVVNVTIDYSYYQENSDEMLSSSQLITVSIVQPDRFTVTSIETPDNLYANQEDVVTVNFVNKGKSILYNLSTEISGDFDTMIAEDAYVGNVNSGTESSADFTIMASEPGVHKGTIIISYEDVNGKVKSQTVPFEIAVEETPVYDMPIDDGGGEIEQPEQRFTMPWWGWAIIAVAVLIIAFVIRKIVVKSHTKKLKLELEQEDNNGLEDSDDEDF